MSNWNEIHNAYDSNESRTSWSKRLFYGRCTTIEEKQKTRLVIIRLFTGRLWSNRRRSGRQRGNVKAERVRRLFEVDEVFGNGRERRRPRRTVVSRRFDGVPDQSLDILVQRPDEIASGMSVGRIVDEDRNRSRRHSPMEVGLVLNDNFLYNVRYY